MSSDPSALKVMPPVQSPDSCGHRGIPSGPVRDCLPPLIRWRAGCRHYRSDAIAPQQCCASSPRVRAMRASHAASWRSPTHSVAYAERGRRSCQTWIAKRYATGSSATTSTAAMGSPTGRVTGARQSSMWRRRPSSFASCSPAPIRRRAGIRIGIKVRPGETTTASGIIVVLSVLGHATSHFNHKPVGTGASSGTLCEDHMANPSRLD